MHIDKETAEKIKADIRLAINALAETKYHDFIPQMQADMARMDLERALRTIEAEEAEEAMTIKKVNERRELKLKAAEDFFKAKELIAAIRSRITANITIEQATTIKLAIKKAKMDKEEAYNRWKSI